MKNILILAALLCAVNLHAISTDSTIPVYRTDGFLDPLQTTDRSQRWLGGSDLSTALTVAESFSLQNNSVLSKVELWSYDTVDGSGGTLQELRYAIYTGATQPTGAPVASGLGRILSSDGIGHVSPPPPDGSVPEHLFVIQTIFNLASAVHLFPDVTYWLAITARTDPFGVSNTAQWAESGKDPAHAGSYLVLTDAGWTEVDKGDRAFELDGQGRRLVTLSKDKVPDGGSSLCLLVLAIIPLLRLRAGRNPEV